MHAGVALALLAAVTGYKGAVLVLQRIEQRCNTIETRHATWVGVGLIVWIAAWAAVCNQIAGT